MLDKIFKALMILGIIIGVGVTLERATATGALAASLEVRMTQVEKQTAANTAQTNETAALLKETAALLRAHEVEDSAVTAQVQRNTEIIDRLVRR